MILTESILVEINRTNINHYESIGYDVSLKDIIEIPPGDLVKNSNKIIHIRCDICGEEKYCKYQNYNKYILNQGYYTCSKCKHLKSKNTKLERYGDENYNNRKQAEKTCLIKYGKNNVSQVDEVKKKKVETNQKMGSRKCFSSR